MTLVSKFPLRSTLLLAVGAFVLAMLWALHTQHVWEDYYITYRASKNLATGHGLVFSPDERVHSFTSPLGVLLPALASVLTLNSSDTAALWIFRLMSGSAFAAAALLLWNLGRRLSPSPFAALLIAGLFVLDNKIIDNSVNGMETGLLLGFLAWTLWALFTAPPRQDRHLGLAWAGLMWTRPDSCVYIAVLSLAALVFHPVREERIALFRTFCRSALITTAVYLPWFAGAWLYYGSPVPHTVTAKGLFGDNTPAALWNGLWEFPQKIVAGESSLGATFLPPLGLTSGWPALAVNLSFGVSVVMMLIWMLPKVRWEARVASFAFAVGQYYLNVIVGFPVSWYIPQIATLGIVGLGLAAGQLYGHAQSRLPALRIGLAGLAGALVLAGGTLSVLAAHHLREQQRIIETGHRRVIGEWLRAEARSPRDTVFLEPLGYIGFFSGLKMLDYPGLSSPEVVAARKRATSRSYPYCWPELIWDLRPDWLVMRPYEVSQVRAADPAILYSQYRHVRTFDVSGEVDAVPFLPGRGYLHLDAVFEVYRRRDADEELRWSSPPRVVPVTLASAIRHEALDEVKERNGTFGAHAPAIIVHPVPAGARFVAGRFGINPEAYADPARATDGAEFQVHLVAADGSRRSVFARQLDPLANPADRESALLAVEIPEEGAESVEFIITAGPAGVANFDWTYWADLRFELPPGTQD